VDKNRQQLLALQSDVDRILQIMNQVEELETALTKEDDRLSSKSMELKNAMKKLLTAPDVLESLNRLEVQGQPTWGLSTEERELIILAREKMNES
jgi:glutamine amidotransferase PdxT